MKVPYDYWPITNRPRLEWPDGQGLAVYVGLNIERFVPGLPATALSNLGVPVDPMNHGWRDYGTRVGVWRMMELLDALDLKASVLLNADVCEAYPQIVAAGVERGWAWLGHGRTNSQFWSNMEEDEERGLLTSIVADLSQATGTAPRGWLGPAMTETESTPRLLAELGFTYILDWIADDQPFPLNVDQHRMISVPYSAELNDIGAVLYQHASGPDFAAAIIDQFDVLYRESKTRPGAVMAISIHPFVANVPFRHKHLERALTHIRGFNDVWFPTTDEIADWYFTNYYDDVVAASSARERK